MSMWDFEFEPLTVGDSSTLGFIEDCQEKAVDEAINYIKRNYGETVSARAVDKVIADFDIDYDELPRYLKRKFDSFEVF